jgi:thiamine pyrophosphokinase
MKKSALVICNGEPPSKKLARELAKESDMIVAADGGANVARLLGIKPDVIIGDLDSITRSTKRFFSTSMLVKVTRQDNTDLEKALDFLVEQKVNAATILAATGKRVDHTLGNLFVAWNYQKHCQLRFIGDGWTAMPIGRGMTVSARKGATVSLIPFGVCSGITLRGLKFPLTNATMKVGEIGVSNVVMKSSFTVTVKKGNMLVMILDDHKRIDVLR